MVRFVSIVLISFFHISFSFASDLSKIRNDFYEARLSKQKTDLLLNSLLSDANKEKSFYKAYTGMCYLLLAKHSYNPYTKYESFNKGKNILESAIKSDPLNIELRFLRLSVQQNSPAMLNYSSNIESDKLFIKENFASINDSDLKMRIKSYMDSIQYKL